MKQFLKILSFILVFCTTFFSALPYRVKAEAQFNVGDIVEFGYYPQSEVINPTLKLILSSRVSKWNSYNYYSGDGSVGSMKPSDDIMKYADVEYNGIKYRGVKFINYRPGFTYQKPLDTCSIQDTNGYSLNRTYWFEYEPLFWRVLDPVEGLMLCEMVIDAQPYNNYYFENKNIEDSRFACFSDSTFHNYASDWETSSIRTWLNNDFFNTSFSDNEKSNIKISLLSNKSWYTLIDLLDMAGDLDSNETNDKVFLLSFEEVINPNLGFDSGDDSSISRRSGFTKYALCQGVYAHGLSILTSGDLSEWTLRSPGYSSDTSCGVSSDGSVDSVSTTHNINGIRPALKVDLNHVLSQTNSNEYGILTPSTTIINYGDGIILHANYNATMLTDCDIVWSSDNDNFIMSVSSDKKTCRITPQNSGETVFTLEIIDSSGNVKVSDTQKMTAKADLYQRIIALIKTLFALNKTVKR